MIEIKSTLTLVATTSKGLPKYWRGAIVLDEAGQFYTQTFYWQGLAGGETSTVQSSAPKLIKPKNVGKTNETTPAAQALSELESMYRKQLDKGYIREGHYAALGDGTEQASKPPILPMLAHKYEDKKHKLTFPVYAQAKENGIRCLWDGENFWSRQGKIILPAATKHLRFDSQGLVIDGELVLPEPYTFQQSISAIKKFEPMISSLLEYRIYDCYDPQSPNEPYWRREGMVTQVVAQAFERNIELKARVVTTYTAMDEDALLKLHGTMIQRGIEGTIIRACNGVYTPGHRSDTLLKLKSFVDEEFEIVGYSDGRGKDAGAVIFRCITEDNQTFDVRPEGSMDERRRIFENGDSYIGKLLTVRYQTRTDGGVPLFPVGVTIRDYES